MSSLLTFSKGKAVLCHAKPASPPIVCTKDQDKQVVVLNGKSVYLGVWETPRAGLSTAASSPNGWRTVTSPPCREPSATKITVSEVILAFWKHAETYYVHPDGSPTCELDNYKDALRPLRLLYGATPAQGFGPNALKAVRQTMIEADLARKTVNARINRVRRMFSWAVAEEIIPVEVVVALKTVPPLRRGRCEVRESKGIHPLAWYDVETTRPHLSKPVAAMVQAHAVQQLPPGGRCHYAIL